MLSCPNQIHSTPIITINMIFNLTTTLLHPIPPPSKNTTTFPYPSIIKPSFPQPKILGAAKLQFNHTNTEPHSSNFLSNLLSLAIAVTTLTSPLSCLAIPSLKSPPSLLPPTTPFSQSKNLATGLDNGKIRACPSINPGCISTNPMSASFAFPWTIPDTASQNAIQQLQQAIMETQKNAKIQVVEDTPDGQYLQAEVDGGFGRDVLEFLVKGDVVVYRCMATKVTYVYPFTTALGDSKGQEERMGKIVNKLGWYAPSLTSME